MFGDDKDEEFNVDDELVEGKGQVRGSARFISRP